MSAVARRGAARRATGRRVWPGSSSRSDWTARCGQTGPGLGDQLFGVPAGRRRIRPPRVATRAVIAAAIEQRFDRTERRRAVTGTRGELAEREPGRLCPWEQVRSRLVGSASLVVQVRRFRRGAEEQPRVIALLE